MGRTGEAYLTSENKSKVAANAIIPSGTGLLSYKASVKPFRVDW